MAMPTVNDVQAVETVLTNLLVGYEQADDRFVASRVFPAVPVAQDSGTYFEFTQRYWFLNEMQARAAGTKAAEGAFALTTGTYSTLQFALEYSLADEVRRNSQVPMDLEQVAVRWLAQQNMIKKEVSFSTDFMKTSVWTTDNTTATDWDDFVSGDPASDILTAIRTISAATGYQPNTMVVGHIVHNALIAHPDLIDRLKYVTMAGVSGVERSVGEILGIGNYIVAKASYTASNESDTTPTYVNIIDDDALVCYVAPNPSIFSASAGYTFAWGAGGGTGTLDRYRSDERLADIVRLRAQWDQVKVSADLGYFFSDIV